MKFIVTLIKYCHPAIDSRVGDTRNETNEFGLPSLGLPPLVPIKDPRVQSRDCCQEMWNKEHHTTNRLHCTSCKDYITDQ